MTSPHNNASSGGCFSGIARLLLCKGSLPTHPSDQLTDFPTNNKTHHHHLHHQFGHSKTDKKQKIEANVVQATAGPGVVARLMGLESLPDTNSVPKGRTLDSVPRSRSVNFMDYLLEFDLEQAQHRRARTSVSFREVPTFLNQENDEFFVVYLDNMEKSRNNRFRSKQRKSELGFGDIKQKNEVKNRNNKRVVKKYEKKQANNNKVSNLKYEPRRVSERNVPNCKRSGQVSSPDHKKEVRRRKSRETSISKRPVKSVNRKEELTESKLMRKIKNQQGVRDTQSECSSRDSSPVSVISLGDFSVDEATSLRDNARLVDSSSMKKGSSTTSSTTFQMSHPIRTSSKNYEQSENQNSGYYIELVTKLCSLTEKELKVSNWAANHAALEFEFCEEMCMELEQQILDILLLQTVEDLVEYC